MSFCTSLLLCVMAGAAILMIGILLTKEAGQSLRSAFTESLVWGGGFFVMLSAQVVAIAAMH